MTSANSSHAIRIQSAGLLLAIGAMLLASAAFAGMNAMAKHLGQTLPPTEVAFARASINALLLVPWMLHRRIGFLGTRRRALALRGLSGACSLMLNFSASPHLALADFGAIFKTSVLFTVALGWLVLGEALTLAQVSFTVLGFVGALVVLQPTLLIQPAPGLMAVGAALFGSFSTIAVRELAHSEHACTIVFQFCAIASFLTLALFGHAFVMPSAQEALALICLGLLGTGGQVMVTLAFQSAPASEVAPYSFSEVLFSTLIGYFFFGEVLAASSYGGALIIVLAGLLLGRSMLQYKRESKRG